MVTKKVQIIANNWNARRQLIAYSQFNGNDGTNLKTFERPILIYATEITEIGHVTTIKEQFDGRWNTICHMCNQDHLMSYTQKKLIWVPKYDKISLKNSNNRMIWLIGWWEVQDIL